MKRYLDIVISFLILIIMSPLIMLITFFIKLNSEGPVLFKQKSVGKNNKKFYILKFRTTKDDVKRNLINNKKIFMTKVSEFLIRTKLDNLLMVINVLRGEMSIVGPKPNG